MATKAIPVFGSTIEWSSDGGTTFTAFAEALNLVVPEESKDYIDVTNLDSPNGFREYLPGLRDGGEISFEANYRADMYKLAKQYSDNSTLIHFKVTLTLQDGQSTVGDVHGWTALVSPSIPSGANGEALKYNLNLRVSGAPSYVEGS